MKSKGAMSLLEPPPENTEKSRVWAFTIVALAVVLLAVLWFTLRYYPEKRAAAQFFDALVAGDTDKAYTLWKPTSSYKKDDFLADWGPTGYYGPVKSYKIMRAKVPLKSETSVEVSVAISPFSPFPESSDEKSRKTKVTPIWVSKSDHSLNFPVPY